MNRDKLIAILINYYPSGLRLIPEVKKGVGIVADEILAALEAEQVVLAEGGVCQVGGPVFVGTKNVCKEVNTLLGKRVKLIAIVEDGK